MVCLDALKHKQPISTPMYSDQNSSLFIGVSSNWSKARKPFPFWRHLVKTADDHPDLNHRCLFCRWSMLGSASRLTTILCPWPMPCVRQGHGYKIFTCIKSRVRLMHGNFKRLSSSTSTVAWTSANGPSPSGVCTAWTLAHGPSPKGVCTAWTLAHGPSPKGVCGAWSLASSKGPAAPERCGPGDLLIVDTPVLVDKNV